MDGSAPKQLGRYSLFQRLARGGMAELHLASMVGERGFARVVVVKRMLPHLAEDPEFARMLLNEAKLAAQLHHPNIVQVLDLSREGEEHFIVMEYIHGADFRTVLRESARTRALPRPCAVAVVLGVAAGLHHAHEAHDREGKPLNIVHRDVNPANVLVGHDGSVKVVDFGIAKALAHTQMTATGTIKGKMGYMAPEQCRGDPVDRRTDVFALGVLLYEATLGRRMFVGDNQFAIMNAVLRADYVTPSALDAGYPPAFEAIIRRALQPDAQDRFSTAAAFADELEAAAAAAGMPASIAALRHHMNAVFGERAWPTVPTDVVPLDGPLSAVTRTRRRTRQRWLVGAAALGGIAFGVAAGANLRSTNGASAEEAEPTTPLGTDQRSAPNDQAPAAADTPPVGADVAGPARDADDGDADRHSLPLDKPPAGGDTPSRRKHDSRKKGRGKVRRAKAKAKPDSTAKTVDDAYPPGLER